MNNTFDQLYYIFENYLNNNLIEEECEDTFVANVVGLYMKEIKKTASVMPQNFLEDIKEDTAELVYDMLLKKTYGYFSLNQYRQSIRSQNII